MLVATINLDGDQLEIYGRRQPLKLPPGLVPIPVVRIETKNPSLGEGQRRRLVQELARRADPRSRPTLQIDFDAKKSERAFYRAVLDAIYENGTVAHDCPNRHPGEGRGPVPSAPPQTSDGDWIPASAGKTVGQLCPSDDGEKFAAFSGEQEISITALASWCLDDRWLEGAPILEAIPMLFDMGEEGPAVVRKLERGQDFAEPLCRKSYGIAIGEPWPPFRPGRPLYVFSDRPWTRQRFRNAANSQR